MSMLSLQVDNLRLMAKLVRDYDYEEISRMLREAADTIESLRDRLQELQGVGGGSRYSELFGTPERASNILALGCMGASEDVCDSCVFEECDGKLRRCGSIHSIATQMLEWLESEVRDD